MATNHEVGSSNLSGRTIYFSVHSDYLSNGLFLMGYHPCLEGFGARLAPISSKIQRRA